MRWMMFALFLCSTLAMPGVAIAQVDEEQARMTVQRQLEAITRGDWNGAYTHAAPNVRRAFPTPQIFEEMVRQGYAPIHAPRAFTFGSAEIEAGGTVVQNVVVTSPDGRDYDATYRLQLQPDGAWRIIGVSLRRSTSLGV